MDGLTTTRTLHRLAPQIKVVMLSIYDDSSTQAQARLAGAVEFVGKHDPAETLIAAIRRAAAGAPR